MPWARQPIAARLPSRDQRSLSGASASGDGYVGALLGDSSHALPVESREIDTLGRYECQVYLPAGTVALIELADESGKELS